MSERSLLAEVVEDLFATHGTAAGGELWARVEDLGLTLPSVPEELGGSGGSVGDEVEILRAAGRHAVALPLLETFLAGWLLSAARLPAEPGPMTVAPLRREEPLTLRPDSGGWLLDGAAAEVAAASEAERIVVLAEDQLGAPHVAVVPAASCTIVAARTVAGEHRDRVEMHRVALPTEAVAAPAAPLEPEQLLRRAALGRAVMIVGALDAVRELTLSHVRERRQFGRALAQFGAVQGHVATIGREVALADAAVEVALEPLLAGAELPLLEVAAAKIVCNAAATRVSAAAHQLHGAIGITTEHPLQLHTRRLWAWRGDAGSETLWARALGEDLLRRREGVWERIAPVARGEER